MANEKIHEYLDTATIADVQNFPVEIDTDVESDGVWVSKKLSAQTLINASNATSTRIFGSFYDTTNQEHSVINRPKAMRMNTDAFTNGINKINDSLGQPTIIRVDGDGIYNFQFSAQITRISGGTSEQISIWFRKNGVDIPYSNTHLNLNSNSVKSVASWNLYLECVANDEIQIMWSVSTIWIQLLSETENTSVPHPATPSLIVTISKI